MIDKNHSHLSIRRQSELLELNRSSLYIRHQVQDNSYLCNMIVEIYSNYPIYGYRRITAMLHRQGVVVNRKAVARLMKELNLRAIYPGPNTSKRNLSEMVYPYLLSELKVTKVNMVWQVDITYLRTNNGFMYLVALIDVYSRLVVGWDLSNSLCTISCINALADGILKYGKPTIINSDQGSQFTSALWIQSLQNDEIRVSMTGKGRSNDNANIERLWRSFKYEGSYLYKWQTVAELKANIPKWLNWYNNARPHQALRYQTPFEKHNKATDCGFMDKSYDLPTIPQSQLQNNLILF
jgi:putative transposase